MPYTTTYERNVNRIHLSKTLLLKLPYKYKSKITEVRHSKYKYQHATESKDVNPTKITRLFLLTMPKTYFGKY